MRCLSEPVTVGTEYVCRFNVTELMLGKVGDHAMMCEPGDLPNV